MTSYQSTQVFGYITHLEKYLKGDLEQFHKICRDVEMEEGSSFGNSSTSGRSFDTSSFSPPETTSTTTTTETTRFPDDFYTGSLFRESIPDERIFFRSTIPHTLTLFSTIDVLGYLSGSNNDPLKTFKNFEEFFKLSDTPISEIEIKVLNLIFRQGLVHVYFPKLNLGISYHSSNPLNKLFIQDVYETVILNVNCLERIVINTLDSIKIKSELFEEMERKYIRMVSDYETSQGRFLTELKETL